MPQLCFNSIFSRWITSRTRPVPGCLGLLFNLDSLLLNLLLVSLLGLHHRQRVRHLQRLRHQWGILLPLRPLNRQPLPHTRLTLHNWVHHFLRRLPLGNIYNHNPKRFFTDTKCTSRSFRSTIKGGNFGSQKSTIRASPAPGNLNHISTS